MCGSRTSPSTGKDQRFDLNPFHYLCPMQEEAPQLNPFVYSDQMVAFVTASNQYCQILEQSATADGKAFIASMVEILSRIYAEFIVLGDTEPVDDAILEPTVTEQDWASVYQQIARIMGPYNETLRPAEKDEFDRSEVVLHTVSEDLADVYQELKDFTVTYSRGLEELMNDAAWELKERFAEHWGTKLLRSLLTLHDLYIKGVDPQEEE